MNEVFSIQIPQRVDCWTFLRNSSFEDNEATRRRIERALVLGAINLWNARRRDNIWRSDKEYTAIWYADFGTSGNSEYRGGLVPKEHLDGLPATDRITGKAWAALVLSIEDREFWDGTLDYRLYDDITDNFFGPLIEQFGLVMYETLRMEGIRGFFDFQATPVVVLTPSQVLVMNEVWQQDGNVPIGLSNVVPVDIVVDEPDEPRFSPAGESLAKIRTTGLVFDVYNTLAAWNQVRQDFTEGIPRLSGSPDCEELLGLADLNGIVVEEVEMGGLGLASVDLVGRLVIPKINIKRGLPRGVKLFTLAHELGHIVLHLPILVAQSIESSFERLVSPHRPFDVRLMDLARECPSIETEADWFAGFILVPPFLEHYLRVHRLPAQGKAGDFHVLLPTGDGRAIENVYEFDVWSAARELLSGEGVLNWASYFEFTKRYGSAHRDQDGWIVRYSGDYDSVASLVVRLTDVIVRRTELFEKLRNPSDTSRREVDDFAIRMIERGMDVLF